jgi:hypothetical protein
MDRVFGESAASEQDDRRINGHALILKWIEGVRKVRRQSDKKSN